MSPSAASLSVQLPARRLGPVDVLWPTRRLQQQVSLGTEDPIGATDLVAADVGVGAVVVDVLHHEQIPRRSLHPAGVGTVAVDAAVVVYKKIPVAGLASVVGSAVRVRSDHLSLDVEHEVARRRQALEAMDDRNLATAQDAGPRPADTAGEKGRIWAGPSFAAVLRNRLVSNGALQVFTQIADQGAIVQLDVGSFVEPQLRVGADVDCRAPSPSTIGRGEGVVEPDHVAVVPRPNAVTTDDDLAGLGAEYARTDVAPNPSGGALAPGTPRVGRAVNEDLRIGMVFRFKARQQVADDQHLGAVEGEQAWIVQAALGFRVGHLVDDGFLAPGGGRRRC